MSTSIYGDFQLNRYPDCIATVYDEDRQKVTAIYNDHRLGSCFMVNLIVLGMITMR